MVKSHACVIYLALGNPWTEMVQYNAMAYSARTRPELDQYCGPSDPFPVLMQYGIFIMND